MEADSASSVEEHSKKLRKRKTPRHMSNIDLRPCEVCGGKASGFHFGAITCEACKVCRFFYFCRATDARIFHFWVSKPG